MGSSYREATDEVVGKVVAPAAQQVDRDGVFPRSGMDALGKAGLLGHPHGQV